MSEPKLSDSTTLFRRARLSKKRALISLLAVILARVVYFIYLSNSNNNAQIKVGSQSSIAPEASKTKYSNLNTPYFSLIYPDTYHLTKIRGAGLVIYESGKQSSDNYLKIELKNGPSSIVLDSDYVYYASHQKIYKLSNKLYGTQIVDIATKINGGEQDALWLKDKYLLVIKFKSGDYKTMQSQMNDIIGSVQWKQ